MRGPRREGVVIRPSHPHLSTLQMSGHEGCVENLTSTRDMTNIVLIRYEQSSPYESVCGVELGSKAQILRWYQSGTFLCACPITIPLPSFLMLGTLL